MKEPKSKPEPTPDDPVRCKCNQDIAVTLRGKLNQFKTGEEFNTIRRHAEALGEKVSIL